jgi:TonB family protein
MQAQTTPKPKPTVATSAMVTAKLTADRNRPQPVTNPGYSPYMEKSKNDGGGPAGENGVDAQATPLGRYMKDVNSAVGSRWSYLVQKRMEFVTPGTVEVIFVVDARGRLLRFRIEDNTSNSAHASIVEESVRAAEFSPPPPELLRNGQFEVPFQFTVK